MKVREYKTAEGKFEKHFSSLLFPRGVHASVRVMLPDPVLCGRLSCAWALGSCGFLEHSTETQLYICLLLASFVPGSEFLPYHSI